MINPLLVSPKALLSESLSQKTRVTEGRLKKATAQQKASFNQGSRTEVLVYEGKDFEVAAFRDYDEDEGLWSVVLNVHPSEQYSGDPKYQQWVLFGVEKSSAVSKAESIASSSNSQQAVSAARKNKLEQV
jgi:hypothetical protein